MATYRERPNEKLRVLFCIGVAQTFFEQESDRLPELLPAITDSFASRCAAPIAVDRLRRLTGLYTAGAPFFTLRDA